MRFFLAIANPIVADQVKVGLSAFGSTQIDQGQGLLALDKIRRSDLDGILISLEPGATENDELFERLRSNPVDAELVLIAGEAYAARLREDKLRGHIFAFLKQPFEAVEFFRTISRLKQKRIATTRVR